jgi:hypothetical protein
MSGLISPCQATIIAVRERAAVSLAQSAARVIGAQLSKGTVGPWFRRFDAVQIRDRGAVFPRLIPASSG